MNSPSFSICIPNYNYANFIGETIQSVFNQTYQDFEIVIVDNASTDNSLEVINSFSDERIHLFRNPVNVGFGPNLDRAVSKARNPYIIMLSSDDLMRPTALEEYARIIEILRSESEKILLVSSIDVIDSNGKKLEQRNRDSYFNLIPQKNLIYSFDDGAVESFSGLDVFKEVYPRMSVPGHFCTTLFSKTLYDMVGGYSSIHPTGPDAHFDYKALLQNATVIFINRPLFAYRIHQNSQYYQTRHNKNLNILINGYLFTIQYADNDLNMAGVNREKTIKFFIDELCLKEGILEICAANRYQGFRCLLFSLSCYPLLTMKNWKTYFLTVFLLLGPLGTRLARILREIYLKTRSSNK